MAQSGQLRGRVSEQQLIGLLDQADGQQSTATAKKGAIVVSERTSERASAFSLPVPLSLILITRTVSKEKRPR